MNSLRQHLVSHALALALGAGGLATAVRAADAPARPASGKPVNVLLIISDDLNTRLGSYGAPVRTPNIDQLAKEGVQFDRAYSQFPLCGPSRASFLTGVRPNTIGEKGSFENFRCTMPDVTTLPQYFRQNGYFAGRIGKAYHQGVPNGIGRSGPDDEASWTAVVNPRGRDKDVESKVVNMTPGQGLGRALAYLEDEGADEDQTDGKVASAAIEMMKAQREKPFFITVGFYRPHVPEIAPKKYFDMYPLEGIPAPGPVGDVLPTAKTSQIPHVGMTPEQQRQMIRAYSAATTYMDSQVGRVLKSLDDLGLRDNTVVVFMGDHGFLLGEHGQWSKTMLWEEATRTPLIIRAPKVAGGKASGKPVELLDLYPTLTELAGLTKYARNEGASLVPLMKRPDDPAWTKPALSQVFGGRSVRTAQWRYTEWEEGKLGVELYDQVADPREMRNLAGEPKFAEVIGRLKALLPAGPVEARKINPEDGRPPRSPQEVLNSEGPARPPCPA